MVTDAKNFAGRDDGGRLQQLFRRLTDEMTARARFVPGRRRPDDHRATPKSSGAPIGGAPADADWAWRPGAWQCRAVPPGLASAASGEVFCGDIKVFHDCPVSELTLRQVRGRGGAGHPGFGIALDVFRFDGSFLSLALDLPQEALAGLDRRHLVGLALDVSMERPLEVYARLNVRHGPNTEQMLRAIPAGSGTARVEFDLAYAELNERRVEAAWLDLIFEAPEMNRVLLGDLVLYRRTRAEL